MSTAQTDDTNIRAKPHDAPVRATAGVRLAQADHIIYRNIEWHECLPHANIWPCREYESEHVHRPVSAINISCGVRNLMRMSNTPKG